MLNYYIYLLVGGELKLELMSGYVSPAFLFICLNITAFPGQNCVVK